MLERCCGLDVNHDVTFGVDNASYTFGTEIDHYRRCGDVMMVTICVAIAILVPCSVPSGRIRYHPIRYMILNKRLLRLTSSTLLLLLHRDPLPGLLGHTLRLAHRIVLLICHLFLICLKALNSGYNGSIELILARFFVDTVGGPVPIRQSNVLLGESSSISTVLNDLCCRGSFLPDFILVLN